MIYLGSIWSIDDCIVSGPSDLTTGDSVIILKLNKSSDPLVHAGCTYTVVKPHNYKLLTAKQIDQYLDDEEKLAIL